MDLRPPQNPGNLVVNAIVRRETLITDIVKDVGRNRRKNRQNQPEIFFFFFFFPSVNVVFALERWRTKFQRVTRPPRFTRKKKKKSFFFPNLYAIKVLLFSLKTNFIVWILFFLFLLLLHFIPFYSIFIDFVYFIFSTLYLKIKFYAEKFY